jgi:hypothetical protein
MSDGLERDDELVRSILDRTSGAPCASARGRLVGFADDELGPIDTALLRMHVGTCASCAALCAVLRQLPADLPLLAEVEPDAAFTAGVLARTTGRAPLAARAALWLSETAASLLRRPRIAWEAAYVGTFVLALIVIVPGSPLAGVPERALEIARVNPVGEIQSPVAELHEDVSRALQSAWRRSAEGAEGKLTAVAQDVRGHSAKIADNLQRGFGTLWAGTASGQEESEGSSGATGE